MRETTERRAQPPPEYVHAKHQDVMFWLMARTSLIATHTNSETRRTESNTPYPGVMGAPCRKMDPKVATTPKTQSPLTIMVEIKIKFDSRIKR